MVKASGRWLGVRLDLLSSLLTVAVALAAVLVSQDAGRYTYISNKLVLSSLAPETRRHQSCTRSHYFCVRNRSLVTLFTLFLL